jgi:hypothetical protein
MALHHCKFINLSRFNPISAEAGIAVPRFVIFTSLFYIQGHAGGLSKMCHKYMTDVWGRFNDIYYTNRKKIYWIF